MTPIEFAEGLNRIGVAVRQVPDKATLGVYFDGIGQQTTGEEWLQFTRWAVATDRFPTFFPKVSELRAALRQFRGAPSLEAEATEAYERALASGTYAPQGGTTWTYRGIRERCGDAAAEAFLAAGGNSAFITTWNEDKRRERFVEAYRSAVLEDATTALLPAGDVKLLPAPALPTASEARALLKEIAGHAPA